MLIASIKDEETIPECVDAVELRLDLNPELIRFAKQIEKPLIVKSERLVDFDPLYYDCDWMTKPLREEGIIRSRHLDHTPKDLDRCFEELMDQPADLYKLATYARSTLDALRMLIVTRRLRAQGKPVIGLCMGEYGQITRVASDYTYAHLGTPTAPGQLSVDELSIYKREEPWFGLIGDPIEQSISHLTHNEHLFFVKLRVHPGQLEAFLELADQLPFKGFAVTVPHKEKVQQFVKGSGPINTLVRKSDGWHGSNTDGVGALEVLGEMEGKRVALLGAGGCAKAIAKELKGLELNIYNRTPKKVLGIETKPLADLDPYDILINATSCGMLSSDCPLREEQLLAGTTVMETITKPEETTLVRYAKAKGCQIIYGHAIFIAQARHQFKIWRT